MNTLMSNMALLNKQVEVYSFRELGNGVKIESGIKCYGKVIKVREDGLYLVVYDNGDSDYLMYGEFGLVGAMEQRRVKVK